MAVAGSVERHDAGVLQALKEASAELRAVDLGHHVERVSMRDLTPLRFATRYVAANKPVIITDALSDWPAMRLWSSEYIAEQAGDRLVTVDLTPNGRADAVTWVRPLPDGTLAEPAAGPPPPQEGQGDRQQWFITPFACKMTAREFFRLLRASRAAAPGDPRCLVPYVQHQDGNMSEWPFLVQDCPGFPWAQEVFGASPEAVNLWIGDQRSVTSFHKDHQENLYAVLRGTKRFHLLPPSDVYRMRLRRHRAARYVLHPDTAPRQAGAGGADPSAAFSIAVPPERDAGGGPDGDAAERPTQPVELVLGRARLVAQASQPAQEVLWTDVDPDSAPVYDAGVGGWVEEGGRGGAGEESLFHDPNLPPPLVAEVRAGEVLYLPMLWFHRVSQRCGTGAGDDAVLAANYWFDMPFDHRWASYRLVESLATRLGLIDTLPVPDDDDDVEEEGG